MILNADRLRARLDHNSARIVPDEFNNSISCRVWEGATQGTKSGAAGQLSVRVNGAHKKLIVHRLALWLKEHPNAHGRVRLPDTLPLARQICGNRTCIEPSHLKRKT